MPRVDVPDYKTFVDFPDGTPPEEMQAVLAKQFPKKPSLIDRAVKGPLARVAQGVNSSLGSALSAFGLDSGAEAYKEGAEYWKKKADAAGSSGIPAQIYEGLGGAPMGVAEFVAGVPYAGAKGAAKGYREGGVPGALKEGALEAVKRAGIGKIFHGIGNANLTPLQRTGAMAGTMGAQTAAEGGSLADTVAATATGALLMPPSGGGAQSVVRSRMQRAGASPEVAADLSGRFDPRVQPAGMGSINANNVDTMFASDPARPPAIRDSEVIALTGNESRPPQPTRGTVLDAENASRLSPYDAIGPSPGLSIEVARLKQEHPYWSDAEYLKEVQRTTLTQNPEVLPARTDADRYAAPPAPAERPAEQAPSRTVEPQSMESGAVPNTRTFDAVREAAGGNDAAYWGIRRQLEGITSKADIRAVGPILRRLFPDYTETRNPDPSNDYHYGIWRMANRGDEVGRIPTSELSRRIKDAVRREDAERNDTTITGAVDKPVSTMVTPEGNTETDRSTVAFNHDSLPTAAVTAADSLVLQDAAPHLKIAVVGTPAEIKALGKQPAGKTTWVNGDEAYVIDVAAARDKYGSVLEAKRALKAGDPEALGYPERPAGEPLQTAAVTKAGEILTEPEAIKQAATAGDVAYAAEGAPADLAAKIEPVADALQTGQKGGGLVGKEDNAALRKSSNPLNNQRGSSPELSDILDAIRKTRSFQEVRGHVREIGKQIYETGMKLKDFAAKIKESAGDMWSKVIKHVRGAYEFAKETLASERGSFSFESVKKGIAHYTEKLDPNAPAGSLKAEFDKNRKANEKFGTEPLINKMRRAAIDSSANVQAALMRLGPQGEHIRRQFDAISGASAKAQLAVEKQREALSGMSLREQQAMGDMVAIDRDLAITKPGYTKIFGKTDAELRAARQTFQKDYGLTDAEMARVENATRQYFDAWKQNTQRMLDAGLIDATQKQALDAQDYSPKQFLEKIDPDSQAFSAIGGGRVTVPDSGIKRLKEGSDSYFRNNPMRLLSEATARIETRIARNEANQELAKLPAGNGIAEAVKPGTPAPAGYEALTYMENGKQKTIHMKSEYAKEWRQNDPLINSELVNWLQWLTGAKLVRAGATGYNPAFLVTNVPRDLVTIWMQAGDKGYSKHAPVAMVEVATDLVKVAGDAWRRKGRYVDYVQQGGGRELLTHEGALSARRENLAPAVAKVQKILSYVNEFSEVVTRLAYRERMIKNGMDPASASKAAGEYVDFSRGGSVAKAVDRMGIPYLNAAIQGTRSIARAAGRDPGAFAYKTAQLMTGAAGIYALNQITNPEGWANVSDREKADNFIIMLPKAFEYTDKDGTTVSPYLKISKEQSTRPFTTVAELFTHWANGGKPTKQQLEMALGSAVPISIDKMPPAAAAFWTYALNADTYRKEPVWKGKQEIEPYAEYTNNTNPIYSAIGKATASPDEQGVMRGGISPERLKAGVEKIITPSNAYLQGVGNVLTDLYEKMNPSDKVEFAKGNYEQLRAVPGISRLLGGAKDTEQFREGIREARTGTATQQFEVNKTLDAMVLRYVKTGKSDAALYDRISDFLDKQSGESRSRLENRITGLMETADLPDRGWWMAVRALQPEDRADQFKARLQTVSPEEQQRMMEIADGLTGFVSDRFIERYEGAQ